MANSVVKKIIAFAVIVAVTIVTVIGLYFGGVFKVKAKEYIFQMSDIWGYTSEDGYTGMYISCKVSKDFVNKYNDKSKYASAEYYTVMLPKDIYQEVSALGKDTDDRSIYAFSEDEIDNDGVYVFCGRTESYLGDIYKTVPLKSKNFVYLGIRDGEVYYGQGQESISFYMYQIDATFGVAEENKEVQYFGQCYVKVTLLDGGVEYHFASVDTQNRFCSFNNQYS